MNPDAEELARLLEQLRAAAGVSGRKLAELSYVHQSRISRILSGKLRPSLLDVEAITRALGADDVASATARELAARAVSPYRSIRTDSEVGWRHVVRDLREKERSAGHVQQFLPTMLPGLLQTAEYAAAAVAGAVPTGEQTEPLVRGKMDRQAVLQSSTRFTFLLMPAAIELCLLEQEGMQAQWRRIVERSLQPNIRICVVDTSQRLQQGPLNTFTIHDERAVTAELFSGTITLTEATDVRFHQALFDYFLSVSRSEEETRGWIAGL